MLINHPERILVTIETLKAANKAEKLAILRNCDDQFRSFLKLCLDEKYSFKVSRLKEMVGEVSGDIDIVGLLLILDQKPAASNDDKQLLTVAASQSPAMFEVVNKILRRNTDCGVADKLVHEAIPGLLSYTPYCRCSGPDKLDKIDFSSGALSQLKVNGMFMNIIKTPNGIEYITRNGKKVNLGVHPE
jgi:hypothetical protein